MSPTVWFAFRDKLDLCYSLTDRTLNALKNFGKTSQPQVEFIYERQKKTEVLDNKAERWWLGVSVLICVIQSNGALLSMTRAIIPSITHLRSLLKRLHTNPNQGEVYKGRLVGVCDWRNNSLYTKLKASTAGSPAQGCYILSGLIIPLQASVHWVEVLFWVSQASFFTV